MENNLISIIVPVYNVEKYIEQCLESLINQSYRNLEILLIDDGSTDKSGEICDNYSEKDNRIRVIHKTNGGLSDARNTGLDIARGAYIGFVDSDDYIALEMYEQLYKLCEKYNADLAAARFIEFDGTRLDNLDFTNDIVVLKNNEMLGLHIKGYGDYEVSFSVWDRLYRKDIIGKIRFPKGRCYEDIMFTTQIFARAKLCVYFDKPLYYYRVRADSISKKDFYTTEGITQRVMDDQIPFLKERIKYLKEIGLDEWSDICRLQYYETLLAYLNRNSKKNSNINLALKELIKEENDWIKNYIKKDIKLKKKIKLYLALVSPEVHNYLWKLWQRL